MNLVVGNTYKLGGDHNRFLPYSHPLFGGPIVRVLSVADGVATVDLSGRRTFVAVSAWTWTPTGWETLEPGKLYRMTDPETGEQVATGQVVRADHDRIATVIFTGETARCGLDRREYLWSPVDAAVIA